MMKTDKQRFCHDTVLFSPEIHSSITFCPLILCWRLDGSASFQAQPPNARLNDLEGISGEGSRQAMHASQLADKNAAAKQHHRTSESPVKVIHRQERLWSASARYTPGISYPRTKNQNCTCTVSALENQQTSTNIRIPLATENATAFSAIMKELQQHSIGQEAHSYYCSDSTAGLWPCVDRRIVALFSAASVRSAVE
jgi:hypothetical protein